MRGQQAAEQPARHSRAEEDGSLENPSLGYPAALTVSQPKAIRASEACARAVWGVKGPISTQLPGFKPEFVKECLKQR